MVRIFSAQTVRWRGIFASHSWIVFKPADAPSYTRYDYTAWGDLPIRMNGFEPDGRWFGHTPQVVFAADGDAAAALVPKIENAIAGYAWRNGGDYRAWPGPNSNTFIAAIMDAVPEIRAPCRRRRSARTTPMTVMAPPDPVTNRRPVDARWLRRTDRRLGGGHRSQHPRRRRRLRLSPAGGETTRLRTVRYKVARDLPIVFRFCP